MYDPKTGKTESVFKLADKSGGEIYGIKIKDSKVYGMMGSSPVEKGEEKQLCSLKKKPFADFKKQMLMFSKRRYRINKSSIPANFAKAFSEKTGFLKNKLKK